MKMNFRNDEYLAFLNEQRRNIEARLNKLQTEDDKTAKKLACLCIFGMVFCAVLAAAMMAIVL
jgi:hypothetical protein